jgi:hypothetical protein
MAMQARQSQVAGMLLVRKRDGLRRSVTDARVLGRRVVVQSRDAKKGRKDHASGRSANPEVSLRGEDKGHSTLLTLVSDSDHAAIIAPTFAEVFGEPRRNSRTPILRKRHYRKSLAANPGHARFLGKGKQVAIKKTPPTRLLASWGRLSQSEPARLEQCFTKYEDIRVTENTKAPSEE